MNEPEGRGVLAAMELRIPPVLAALLFAAAMWLVSRLMPGGWLPPAVSTAAFIACLAAAAGVGLSGVAAFRKAKTTVNPLAPEKCSSLVVSGVFNYTRNPMYLALLLALLGWGMYLDHPFSLLLACAYVPWMNRFQIIPEERALEKSFGGAFRDYARKTRRWI